MNKFCPNCGSRLKTEGKFCPSCGRSIAMPIKSNLVIGYWPAKEVTSGEDYGKSIKGSLAVGQKEIIFYADKFFSKKSKEWRKIPITGIKSIYRTPIFNITTIRYNQKPGKRSFFSRIFNGRNVSYKISNWQSFIENVKRLNPNIK